MSTSDIIGVLSQKLKITDKATFSIYSLDSTSNSIKRKLEPDEAPMELVANDISKKLKLAVLHDDDANKLQGGAQKTTTDYYTVSGKTVVGPYPRAKEHILPHTDDLMRHRKLLNADIIPYMNLTLIVEGGKERLYSLRSIVEKRCPSLLLAVSYIKKKKEKKGITGPMTIEYKDGTIVNLFIMTQILEWCYTSTLDFDNLTIPDVMVILKASKELDIPHLQFICEQYIRSELSVDSSFVILKQATMLEMEDMKTLATQFAHAKWSQFTQHKGGMEIIGIELFQELTVAMSTQQNNGRSRSIGGLVTVKDTLVEDFHGVYTDARFVDAEFVVTPPVREDGSQQSPVTFPFHKAILAAYSKPLFNMIAAQPKAKQFVLDGLFGSATSDLLCFIYYGKTDLDPIGACQIVEHAMNKYSLHAIREAASFSIANGITIYNSISILRMTYLPQCKHRSMVKLREAALAFICENYGAVDIPSLRGLEHSHFGLDLMADVLEAYYFYKNPAAAGDKKTSAPHLDVAAPSPRRSLVHDIPIPRRSTGGKKSAR